jgi:hypothetical protein
MADGIEEYSLVEVGLLLFSKLMLQFRIPE